MTEGQNHQRAEECLAGYPAVLTADFLLSSSLTRHPGGLVGGGGLAGCFGYGIIRFGYGIIC